MNTLAKNVKETKEMLLDAHYPFSKKIEAVVMTWKLCQDESLTMEQSVFTKAVAKHYRTTLRIVLNCKWLPERPFVKRKLASILKMCQAAFSRTFPDSAVLCQRVMLLVFNPWRHPTLDSIFNDETTEDDEVCRLIEIEGHDLLFIRLEALCEVRCEDLASRLADSYLRHIESSDCHQIDVIHLKAASMALLFKLYKLQEFNAILNNLNLSEGLQLIKFYLNHCDVNRRIWKQRGKLAEIVVRSILATSMWRMLLTKEDQSIFGDLVTQWSSVILDELGEDSIRPIFDAVREVMLGARSSLHIYIFIQVLHQKYGEAVRPVCVELLIRALTTNLNEIEELKIGNDDNALQESQVLLSNGFLRLGTLFGDNQRVLRESLLTAFSLNPTLKCLNRLRHLPQTPVDANDDVEAPFDVDAELLEFTPHLPEDLSIVLNGPRYRPLSWSLGRERLLSECERYLNEREIRSTNPILLFVNVDYSLFEMPNDETDDDILGLAIFDETDVDYNPRTSVRRKRKKRAERKATAERPRSIRRKKRAVPTTSVLSSHSVASTPNANGDSSLDSDSQP